MKKEYQILIDLKLDGKADKGNEMFAAMDNNERIEFLTYCLNQKELGDVHHRNLYNTMHFYYGRVQEKLFTATAEALAIEFSKLLLLEIGAAGVKEANERNVAYVGMGELDVCASDDTCDSNMVMDAAFNNVMKREFIFNDDVKAETEKQNENDTNLVNAARKIAKRSDFFIDDKLQSLYLALNIAETVKENYPDLIEEGNSIPRDIYDDAQKLIANLK